MVRYSVRFTGRVQGVGFRFFAAMNAEKCHLSGWVKNMKDSSVVAQVQGISSDVDKFVEMMRHVNSLIRIDEITKEEMEIVEKEKGFQVKY